MILLIDNYDSFTYNLYQYIEELGYATLVARNDRLSIEEIERLNPEAIVLSPGPGRPENAGICVQVIQRYSKDIPILGICLGHQAIGYAFGGKIVGAKKIMHGKVSMLSHDKTSIFTLLPEKLEVMRYHSLVMDRNRVPAELEVLATSADDGEIMAVRHRHYQVIGLQFHPESIGTINGKKLLSAFFTEIGMKEVQVHENFS